MHKDLLPTTDLLSKLQQLLDHVEEQELWSISAFAHSETAAFSSPFNIDRPVPFNWRGRSSPFTKKMEN